MVRTLSMRWPRAHYAFEPSLLTAVRSQAERDRQDPGAVMSRWAELGRRAESLGLTAEITAKWAATKKKP